MKKRPGSVKTGTLFLSATIVTKAGLQDKCAADDKKSPTAVAVGDSQLDIKVYPNVLPFVNSAFIAQAVHVRFRIFACHKKRRKQQIMSLRTAH